MGKAQTVVLCHKVSNSRLDLHCIADCSTRQVTLDALCQDSVYINKPGNKRLQGVVSLANGGCQKGANPAATNTILQEVASFMSLTKRANDY